MITSVTNHQNEQTKDKSQKNLNKCERKVSSGILSE